ncbi:hypothetical protein VTN96DRAFT_4573 [Rasamsonia emersonii]
MLTGRFAESETLRTSGSVTIKLDDDDQEAMLILMRIIHGKFYSVSAVVDFNTLKRIAILVDKYSLHETVHYFINGWVNGIRMPTITVEDLKTWLCISWVFDLPQKFQTMSRSWLLDSQFSFNAPGLPIPAQVVAQLNSRRKNTIAQIMDRKPKQA